ncbi:MAG: translocation/assembly module TamB [Spirochaetaceae bacterium]|nr:translocation/assembly module TamB [Spirochaetaceae bacterium]
MRKTQPIAAGEILFSAVILAAVAVMAVPAHYALSGTLKSLNGKAMASLQKTTGHKISYGKMTPVIFSGLDITDAAVHSEGRGAKDAPVFSVDRIRLKYSFAGLLTGNPLKAFTQVRIDRPVFALDSFEGLFESINKNKEDNDGEGGAEGAFAELDKHTLIAALRGYLGGFHENFHIEIARGEALVSIGKNIFSIKSFSLNTFLRNDNLIVKTGWNAEAELSGITEKTERVVIPGSAEGIFNISTVRGDFTVSIPELHTNYFTLSETRFLTVWTEQSLVMRKIDDRYPYEVSFFADFEGQEYHAKLSAEQFSPKHIFTLNGGLANYNKYLDIELNGTGGFEKNNSDGIKYEADFKGGFNKKIEDGVFRLNFKGNNEHIDFSPLSISLPRGELSWTGRIAYRPFTPNGTLSVRNLALISGASDGGAVPLTGKIQLTGGDTRINAFAEEFSIGDTVLSMLDVAAIRAEDDFDIQLSALRFHNIESYYDVSLSRINANANLNMKEPYLSVNLRLDSFRLSDILNIAGSAVKLPLENILVKNFSKDISVTTEIFLETDFSRISYDIPHFVTAYHGVSEIIAVLKLSGTEKNVELIECHIAYNEGIDLTARADYSNPDNIVFAMESAAKKQTYETKGSFINQSTLVLNSNYGFKLSAFFNNSGGAEGSVIANSMYIPFLPIETTLDLSVDFSIQDKNTWNISLDQVEIKTKTEDALETLLSFSGGVNQERAEIKRLVVGGAPETLYGNAYFEFMKNEAADSSPDFFVNLSNSDNSEFIRGNGNYHDDAFDIHFDIQNFSLYRFILADIDIVLNAAFDVVNYKSPNSFEATFNFESITGRLFDKEFAVTVMGLMNGDELTINDGNIYYANMNMRIPYLSMNRQDGRFDSIAELTGVASGRDIAASIQVGLENMIPPSSWFSIGRAFEEFSGKIAVGNRLVNAGHPARSFDFELTKYDRNLKISGGPGDMLDVEIDGEGGFYASFTAPSPVQGIVLGLINDSGVDIHASNLFIDLEKLKAVMPENLIVIPAGGVVLADFTITGNRSDPLFWGSAQSFGTKILIPQYITADIGPAPITARINGDVIEFDPIVTPAGSGEGYITGSFGINRWLPRNFNLSINAARDAPLPYSLDFSPILSRGIISGDLDIIMNDNTLTLLGDLIGSDSVISLSSLDAEPGNTAVNGDIIVQTDIKIMADRKVEFLWPSDDLLILRANIDAGGFLSIKSDTLTDKFSLVGNIGLRGGELFYFQRSFYIKEGALTFNESELSFEPRITARAEVRDRYQDGSVIISIIIDDQPLASFTPRIVSEPALSQVEILSLLGNTFSGSPNEENKIPLAFVSSTADLLSQFAFFRRAERLVRDALHIDMFSARTQILQNVVLQNVFRDVLTENITTAEGEAASPQNNPGAYFDNSTIFAGKYIGRDMFVQAMISSRFDKNKLDFYGLTLALDLGIELTNPLFNIRWDTRLLTEHQDALFIEDAIKGTSITLQKTWHL